MDSPQTILQRYRLATSQLTTKISPDNKEIYQRQADAAYEAYFTLTGTAPIKQSDTALAPTIYSQPSSFDAPDPGELL